MLCIGFRDGESRRPLEFPSHVGLQWFAMAAPIQLVRRELPLWAVLALNIFELARRPAAPSQWEQQTAAFSPLSRSGHELAECSCAPEPPVAAAPPAPSPPPCGKAWEIEGDEVAIAAVAGLLAWLLLLVQWVKGARERRRRRRPVSDDDDEEAIRDAQESARPLRG